MRPEMRSGSLRISLSPATTNPQFATGPQKWVVRKYRPAPGAILRERDISAAVLRSRTDRPSPRLLHNLLDVVSKNGPLVVAQTLVHNGVQQVHHGEVQPGCGVGVQSQRKVQQQHRPLNPPRHETSKVVVVVAQLQHQVEVGRLEPLGDVVQGVANVTDRRGLTLRGPEPGRVNQVLHVDGVGEILEDKHRDQAGRTARSAQRARHRRRDPGKAGA
ncbi:MFS transporter [Babesia caballi]|uniref:MFS transporter n=1 Tax=Babesia caballi TaxID=5871 RepID=A0AAV4LU11_BABCB|nr:MFS transporter [Babesia caballi]